MRTFLMILVAFFLTTTAFAKTKKSFEQQAIEKYGIVPNFGIQERRPFIQFSMGLLYQSLPNDSVTLPRFNFAYVYVNKNFMQIYEVKVALSKDDHVLDFGYGIGIGQYAGWWHIGLNTNIGYGHFYEAGHIHSLHYAIGPFFSFGIPPGEDKASLRNLMQDWRFHISANWAGVAVSNGNYSGTRNLGGFSLELGVAFAMD